MQTTNFTTGKQGAEFGPVVMTQFEYQSLNTMLNYLADKVERLERRINYLQAFITPPDDVHGDRYRY